MRKKIFLLISLTAWSLFLLMSPACTHITPSSTTEEPLATIQALPEPTSTACPTQVAIPISTLTHIDTKPRSWNRYAGFDWKHDGYPYESDNFIVFSDSEDRITKGRFALEAEKALVRILSIIEIPENSNVPLKRPKMEIFISAARARQENGQMPRHG